MEEGVLVHQDQVESLHCLVEQGYTPVHGRSSPAVHDHPQCVAAHAIKFVRSITQWCQIILEPLHVLYTLTASASSA